MIYDHCRNKAKTNKLKSFKHFKLSCTYGLYTPIVLNFKNFHGA